MAGLCIDRLCFLRLTAPSPPPFLSLSLSKDSILNEVLVPNMTSGQHAVPYVGCYLVGIWSG